MFRKSLTLLCGSVALCLLPVTNAQDVGDAYCFGNDCPCDNDDPNGGSANSTGSGAVLAGSGSASISADDLTLCGTNLPQASLCLVLISGGQADLPFKDGKLCLAPSSLKRLAKHSNSNNKGKVCYPKLVGSFLDQGRVLSAGETWNFQLWYRDGGKGSPCGTHANTSNALSVTFTP
jgi:hypothetical protein